MKYFYIILLILCSVISAKAQFGVGGGGPSVVGKISGIVVDSISKKPLDYATVSIFRSGSKTPINGVLTDEKGNFKLNNVRPGDYKIAITFIGYPTKIIDPITTTLSKPDKSMGVVIVSPSAQALKEVVVTGQAALIENRIDKIVYNAEKDLTSAGGNATDVLQKVPLVAVDINGNVSLRGDGNVRVLINGKPSGALSASLSDALKTIPADQIKSIEVITSPSAKYDAEGSAGIINIVTKQKNMSGISGSVSGGIGTRQNNGNINFNYNKNRFSFSANLSGNLTWPQTSLTNFDQRITTSDTTTTENNYKSTSKVSRHAIMGSATMSYDINNFNNITSSIRLNQGGFKIDGSQNGELVNDTISLLTHHTRTTPYTGNTSSNNSLGGFDWSADYTHKFAKEGHEIDISGQWSHSIVNTDFNYNYSAVNPTQKGTNDGTNNEYTIQADYTLPVSKVIKVEAGGKGIFRRLSSDYNNFNLTGSDLYIHDDLNSNIYNYNQNVYAGYTVLTFTLPNKYAILAGARYENTGIDGQPINNLQPDLQPFHNSYNTFIPSITLQKQLDATQTLKLTYSKRITRPSLQFLNPFINRSNVQSQSQGNPQLSPEISQTLELNYNTFIKSSVINFSVYYKHTSNLIEGIAAPTPDSVAGRNVIVNRTTYANIGNNNSIGASFYGSINPVKILTIRGSINAYTYKPDPSGIYQLEQTSNGTYLQYNAFLSGSLNFANNLIAETYAVINSPRRTIQGTYPSFAFYAIGVKRQFLNKKAAIGINTVSPFSKYKDFDQHITTPGLVQNSHTQFPFRSVGLTFSYNFGKTTFSNPTDKKKGINNDDLKKDDQGGGMGGGGGGGAPNGSR